MVFGFGIKKRIDRRALKKEERIYRKELILEGQKILSKVSHLDFDRALEELARMEEQELKLINKMAKNIEKLSKIALKVVRREEHDISKEDYEHVRRKMDEEEDEFEALRRWSEMLNAAVIRLEAIYWAEEQLLERSR